MISLQFVTARMNAAKRAAGVERNDIVLNENDLPGEIDSWQQASFSPARGSESAKEDALVWTHAWTFQKDGMSAYVAFDQAGFMHWHDLTVCYEALGWRVASKQVVSNTAATERWPVVVAGLEKLDGTTAMLVFSLFFDNGDPVDARSYEVAATAGEGFKRLLGARFEGTQRTSKVASIRQSQVLVAHTGTLSSDEANSIINLHLQTRQSFRNTWLEHWRRLRVVGRQFSVASNYAPF
jgi:hypothetical protein